MINSFKLMNLEVKIILLGILLINISTFMLTPFLALYMNTKDFPATQIGIVLTSGLIFQQGLNFFGGLFGDRFGYKKIMLIGIIIRILGYVLFIYSNTLLMLVLASSFVGIGGALITPSTKASLATTEEDLRGKAFALRSVAVNIGAALGPILGAVLYKVSFVVVFFSAVFTHFVLMILVITFLKNFQGVNSNNIFYDFKNIIFDSRLVKLTAISSLFWIVYAQLTISIPLYLKDFLHAGALSGTLFTINGLLVICLQFHMISFFEKKFSQKFILFYGMMFISMGFILLGLISSIVGVYLFILLFTLGEILIGPTIDNMASTLATNKNKTGGYLGFVSLGWAIGGSLGNLIGGNIYHIFLKNNDFWLLWLSYALLSVVAAIMFKNLRVRNKINKIAQNIEI